ncbi:Allene oxide synthase [Zostera marina]|uniref:Allene oxide synthase n=1 Tax=Zostera marina TaxID=29655 RepID=A0A0K9NZR1_ZOSMR|nr:Allene oxide synthase [Zostera marina]
MPAIVNQLKSMEIPGEYGNWITAIQDRIQFYKGNDAFFQTKKDQHNSTVYRSNMPPGPFMAKDPKCIVLLDAKSFPILFDVSRVEKKDVFTGTYMPSTSLTGGYRMLSYLDPSEEKHTQVKTLLFRLLASRKHHVIPEFRKAYNTLFENMELEIAKDGKSDFNAGNDQQGFEFACTSFFGVSPSSTDLGTSGPDKAAFWLVFHLHPLVSIGLPTFLEELFLHTFPLPPIFAKPSYNSLYSYFSSGATHALDVAESLGLSREEACHNLLFATVFNTYGGIKILFPGIMKCLAEADKSLHSRLASEIRREVKLEGGKVTMAAIEKMELTKSVVYEALRIDPPVKFQYGKAKVDMTIDSHDARYDVKKGEMLFGYQPFATKDERVFENADKFVGDRFVGEEGKKLLKYVVWSNGPETEDTTVANKQCAGKNFVVLVGRLLVVEFFLKYDTFTGETASTIAGLTVNVTSVTKATS